MKWLLKMLQNLPYFWNMKTQIVSNFFFIYLFHYNSFCYIISSSKNLLFLKSVAMMILFASNLHLFMRRPAKQRATEKENFQKSHGNSSMIEMFEQRFHPFSGWVFFHKAAYKKVQGMPTCLGCVASEILDVDICTKSAKAMSSYKQDRNL